MTDVSISILHPSSVLRSRNSSCLVHRLFESGWRLGNASEQCRNFIIAKNGILLARGINSSGGRTKLSGKDLP